MENNLIAKTLELLDLEVGKPFEFMGLSFFVDEEGNVKSITFKSPNNNAPMKSHFTLQDLLNNPEAITKIPAGEEAKEDTADDDEDDNSIILKATREGANGCNMVINGSTNEIVQVIVSVINGCIEGVIEKNSEMPRSRVAADIMTKITLGLLLKD